MDSFPSAKIRAGVLWNPGTPSKGSQPLSRYGDCISTILPSVLPATTCKRPGGLHRFEPVEWNGITSAPGNITYPTRNFATLGPFIYVSLESSDSSTIVG